MYDRLLKAPLLLNKSFFLFGPRGTGKTSWVKSQFKNSIYLDLLESNLYTTLSANPQQLERLILPNFDGWVVLDEVQKIPELLNEVHRLVEKYRYKFVLTGSSARSLRKKGVNLLAGRALTFSMYPLTCEELGRDFHIETVLKYGSLPDVFIDIDPKMYLESYVNTYIREEVLHEGLTRNIGGFNRFLEVASFSQGQVLNISEVAREAFIHRKVVENYFDILEDLLLAHRLPIFTKRAKRKLIAHRKFYFFDVGVFRAIRPRGPLDTPEEIDGAALETLLFQELRAINDYFQYEYNIYFWRTQDGLEVDFVLYGPRGIIAFEIKRSRSITSKDLRPLNEFAKDYPGTKLYCLYGGERVQYIDNIQVIPFVDALKNLKTLLDITPLGL